MKKYFLFVVLCLSILHFVFVSYLLATCRDFCILPVVLNPALLIANFIGPGPAPLFMIQIITTLLVLFLLYFFNRKTTPNLM
jgi:hypothetical protein